MTDWRTPRRTHLTMPHYAAGEIIRRRRQILVHSAIYYVLNENVIPDHLWQQWAFELAYLQDDYGSDVGFYDSAFQGWDGSSGYYLPSVVDADVMRVARRTLQIAKGAR